MTIGALLYAGLVADSGVSTLVGTRIYPVFMPPSPTMPAVSYQRISNTEQAGTSTLRVTRIQVDCWDDDFDGVQALAAAVKGALEEWTDTDQIPAVKMSQVVGEFDTYESETGLYRVSIDVLCNTIGD
jgi:hypothetical protein